jgi:mono/diheme cytochrome c family protein
MWAWLRSSLLVLCAACACTSAPHEQLGTPKGDAHIVRGRALSKGLAACGFCHGQTPNPAALMVGGRAWFDRYGEVRAPNLTTDASGIGSWRTSDIMQAMREGKAPAGELLSKEAHDGYEWMADEDLLSIVAYLKSLPPVVNQVERRSVSALERNTTGLMESRYAVQGYVPVIDSRYALEYGKYLVDHVARCGLCHNQRGGMLSSFKYLGGGELVRAENGEKLAPAIGGAAADGLGSWSENEIVHYLQSGETPEHNISDPAYCPVGFYANADERDLRAIAKYLKSVS